MYLLSTEHTKKHIRSLLVVEHVRHNIENATRNNKVVPIPRLITLIMIQNSILMRD